jgi:hypothetical protein
MYVTIGLSKMGRSFVKQSNEEFEPLPMPDDFYIVMEYSTDINIVPIIAEGGDILITENEA